jgi:hypothetical protein
MNTLEQDSCALCGATWGDFRADIAGEAIRFC